MKRKFVKFYWVGYILFLLAAFLFLIFKSSGSLTDQILYQGQLVATAGSKTVEIFVSNLGFQVSTFSTRPSIVSPNATDTNHALSALINGWKDTPVVGAVLTDTKGIVRYGYGTGGITVPGTDLSDRDYFKWASTATQGQIYIGDPIISRVGASKGKYIIPLAVPILNNNKFSGVLVVPFLLYDLRTQYLDDLKVKDDTRIYLVDKDGVILSGPPQNLIGRNYLDYVSNSGITDSASTAQKLKKALSATKPGNIDIILPAESQGGVPTRFLVGYAPINIDNTHWLLVIATPASEALVSITPFYISSLTVIGLVTLVSIAIAVYLAVLTSKGNGPISQKK